MHSSTNQRQKVSTTASKVIGPPPPIKPKSKPALAKPLKALPDKPPGPKAISIDDEKSWMKSSKDSTPEGYEIACGTSRISANGNRPGNGELPQKGTVRSIAQKFGALGSAPTCGEKFSRAHSAGATAIRNALPGNGSFQISAAASSHDILADTNTTRPPAHEANSNEIQPIEPVAKQPISPSAKLGVKASFRSRTVDKPPNRSVKIAEIAKKFSFHQAALPLRPQNVLKHFEKTIVVDELSDESPEKSKEASPEPKFDNPLFSKPSSIKARSTPQHTRSVKLHRKVSNVIAVRKSRSCEEVQKLRRNRSSSRRGDRARSRVPKSASGGDLPRGSRGSNRDSSLTDSDFDDQTDSHKSFKPNDHQAKSGHLPPVSLLPLQRKESDRRDKDQKQLPAKKPIPLPKPTCASKVLCKPLNRSPKSNKDQVILSSPNPSSAARQVTTVSSKYHLSVTVLKDITTLIEAPKIPSPRKDIPANFSNVSPRPLSSDGVRLSRSQDSLVDAILAETFGQNETETDFPSSFIDGPCNSASLTRNRSSSDYALYDSDLIPSLIYNGSLILQDPDLLLPTSQSAEGLSPITEKDSSFRNVSLFNGSSLDQNNSGPEELLSDEDILEAETTMTLRGDELDVDSHIYCTVINGHVIEDDAPCTTKPAPLVAKKPSFSTSGSQSGPILANSAPANESTLAAPELPENPPPLPPNRPKRQGSRCQRPRNQRPSTTSAIYDRPKIPPPAPPPANSAAKAVATVYQGSLKKSSSQEGRRFSVQTSQESSDNDNYAEILYQPNCVSVIRRTSDRSSISGSSSGNTDSSSSGDASMINANVAGLSSIDSPGLVGFRMLDSPTKEDAVIDPQKADPSINNSRQAFTSARPLSKSHMPPLLFTKDSSHGQPIIDSYTIFENAARPRHHSDQFDPNDPSLYHQAGLLKQRNYLPCTIRGKSFKNFTKKFRPVSQQIADDVGRLLRIKSDIHVNLAETVGKIKLKITSKEKPKCPSSSRACGKFSINEPIDPSSVAGPDGCHGNGYGSYATSSTSDPRSASKANRAGSSGTPRTTSIRITVEENSARGENQQSSSWASNTDSWDESDAGEDDDDTPSDPGKIAELVNDNGLQDADAPSASTLPDLLQHSAVIIRQPSSKAESTILSDNTSSSGLDAGDEFVEFQPGCGGLANALPSVDNLSVADELAEFSPMAAEIFNEVAAAQAELAVEAIYNSRFAFSEPLYQVYQQQREGTFLQRHETVASADSNESQKEKRRELMVQASAFGSQRSLWCELPEVKRAGLLEKLDAKERKLQEALFEVITSEASYQRSLNVLITHFMASNEFSGKPSFSQILSVNERKQLFSNILQVRDASERLLCSLENKLEESLILNDICTVLAEHLLADIEVYVKYCSRQIYQERMLNHLKKARPEFCRALEVIERQAVCQSLSMRSFLLLPMQRVTRYPLLIDAVYRRIEPASGKLYEAAKRALHVANKLVKHCNDGARQVERMEQIFELDKCLVYGEDLKRLALVSSTRYLVKTGTLTQVYLGQQRGTLGRRSQLFTPKVRYLQLLLLTDLLLLTKKRKHARQYVVVDYCARNMVEATPLEPTCPQVPPGTLSLLNAGLQHLFLFTLMRNSKEKQLDYLFATDSEVEKERWIAAFKPPVSQGDERLYESWDCPQAVCISAHPTTQEDELQLEVEDVVNIQRKMPNGWFEGERLRDGERGWFPATCVREILSDHVRAANFRQRLKFIQAAESLQQAASGGTGSKSSTLPRRSYSGGTLNQPSRPKLFSLIS